MAYITKAQNLTSYTRISAKQLRQFAQEQNLELPLNLPAHSYFVTSVTVAGKSVNITLNYKTTIFCLPLDFEIYVIQDGRIDNLMCDIADEIHSGEVASLEDWFNDNDNLDEDFLWEIWKELDRPSLSKKSDGFKRLQEFLDNSGWLDPVQTIYEIVRTHIEANIDCYL